MLVLMDPTASARDLEQVCDRITDLGFKPHVMPGTQTTAIGITGNSGPIPEERFAGLTGIARLIPVSEPYKLVSRRIKPEGTRLDIRGTVIGGPGLVVIAGPCSVESREQILETAHAVKAAGAQMLRGGAFKPRTSPYSFQGLKEDGLALLAEAREVTGLAIVTEVKDTETLPAVEEVADILQVGARNMHNYTLLEAVGRSRKPVLLKRGLAASIKELLMAAEYIVSSGNHNVILCERGIRTFETMTRNTFDVGAIAVLKHLSHLPVMGDPSHGIGIAEHVPAMARAAVAAGADGLLVEVHPDPKAAWSDGRQSLAPETFAMMMAEVAAMGAALNRPIEGRESG
jgi:3-deoxy-7-phosphoheptulonate synthase